MAKKQRSQWAQNLIDAIKAVPVVKKSIELNDKFKQSAFAKFVDDVKSSAKKGFGNFVDSYREARSDGRIDRTTEKTEVAFDKELDKLDKRTSNSRDRDSLATDVIRRMYSNDTTMGNGMRVVVDELAEDKMASYADFVKTNVVNQFGLEDAPTLSECMDQLKTNMDTLEADNVQLAADKEALEADNAQLAADKESLEADNTQLMADKDALDADNAQLRADNEKLNAYNGDLIAENVYMKAKPMDFYLRNMKLPDEMSVKQQHLVMRFAAAMHSMSEGLNDIMNGKELTAEQIHASMDYFRQVLDPNRSVGSSMSLSKLSMTKKSTEGLAAALNNIADSRYELVKDAMPAEADDYDQASL